MRFTLIRRIASRFVIALPVLIFPKPSFADEVLYACSLQQGSSNLRFAEADQVAIDIEAQSVDLRVARTIGTSEPVNWKFQTYRTSMDDDRFAIRRTPEAIIGGGTFGAAAHAFELHDGILTWTVVMLAENWTMRWRCQR